MNAKEKNGRTPLHWTTYTGATETAKLLIEKGADVNSADKFGQTPLFTAKSNWSANTAEIAKVLIRKGGKAPARDATGKTAEEHKAEDKQAYDNAVQKIKQETRQAQQSASGSGGNELVDGLFKSSMKGVVNAYTDKMNNIMRDDSAGGGIGVQLTRDAYIGTNNALREEINNEIDKPKKRTQTAYSQPQSQANVAPKISGSNKRPGGMTTDQLRAAALKCKESSRQNTGEPQADTGCSMVAFDVCIYKSTGVTDYNKEAKTECTILKQTFGDGVCRTPCKDAAKLP